MRLALVTVAALLAVAPAARAQIVFPGAPPPVVAPGAPGPESSTLGGDNAHRNAWTGTGLRPPLTLAWQVAADPVHAAIAVGPRVVFPAGSAVTAVDASTGSRLWSVPLGAGAAIDLASDGTRVYVAGGQSVAAVDAATGGLAWAAATAGGTPSAPAVADGRVFTGRSSGRVTAYQASTGEVLWDVAVPIAGARPAVSGGRVYVTGRCRAAALDAATGATIWATSTCPISLAPDTATRTILAGQLVLSEDNAIYAAADGRRLLPGPAPGTVGGGLIFRSPLDAPARELVARDAGTFAPRWTWVPALPGSLLLRPAVTDGVVWQAVQTEAEGIVIAGLDPATGAERWSGFVPEPPGAPKLMAGRATAIAVSPGLLLIPSGGELVALRNAPEGRLGVTATLPRNVVTAREKTVIRGRLTRNGHGLIGPRALRLEADPFPFDDGYDTVGAVIAGRRGFTFAATVRRNTRYRLIADGVTYPPTVVYAQPVLALTYARTRTDRVVRATLRIRAERGLRRAGTVAVYRLPRGGRVAKRLGSGRSTRRGIARFAVRVPANLKRTDRVLPCLRGASRRGFGAPNVLDRGCGAARIRVPRAAASRRGQGPRWVTIASAIRCVPASLGCSPSALMSRGTFQPRPRSTKPTWKRAAIRRVARP